MTRYGDRSWTVLTTLALLQGKIPNKGGVGAMDTALRAYPWSAFFTSRYEGAAATQVHQDVEALVERQERQQFRPSDYVRVPVMHRGDYPLPTLDQLKRVGWPRGADRPARAVLAVNLHFSAHDFDDGPPVSYDCSRRRYRRWEVVPGVDEFRPGGRARGRVPATAGAYLRSVATRDVTVS